ncbi:apolipoprotein A-I-like [Heptranchias perlo]|uniref:apolipoprotein A-I-like n=1 Tax=Heptranchias perlo TaxID=212740 RepID=UPI0035595C91
MKTIVMILVLLITGTRGAVLWQVKPPTGRDELRNTLQSYLSQVSDTARGTIEQIDNQEMVKHLNRRISENLDNLNGNVKELQKKVTPLSDAVCERLVRDSVRLQEQIQMDLKQLKGRILLHTEDLRNRINQYIEQCLLILDSQASSLKEQVTQNAKDLCQRLTPLAAELGEKIKTNIEGIDVNITPHVQFVQEMLNQRLEEFHQNAPPYANEISEKFYKNIEEMKLTFIPVAQDVQQSLTPCAENLKSRLTSLWDTFHQNFN